jgi:hypothetical protein
MRTAAPWQIINSAKSIGIFFILVSVAWIAANYMVFQDFLIGWPVILGNVFISGVAGLWWYRSRQHTRFSWDEEGLELQRGRTSPVIKRWKEVSQVSLVHEGYGRFAVRLYGQDGDYLDIPVSDLRLEPSDFRFEVMDLVGAKVRSTDRTTSVGE